MAVTHPWLNRVVLPRGVLLAYFAVPVNAENAPIGSLGGIAVSLAGLGIVAAVIVDEVRRSQKRLRLIHLALALELVLVIFSFSYYVLALHDPDEFIGLHTRLDALYFSTTTVATVGYGDVSAAGQLARGLVTIQLVFNLVFVAALAGLFQNRLAVARARAETSENT